MFRSLSNKGNSSSSSSKKKTDSSSTTSRRRAGSTVSSSSTRKTSRVEDRPTEPFEANQSSSKYQYPSGNGLSGPSPYTTAPDPRTNDYYEYGPSNRPVSLTENAIRALSTQDDTWEDIDARSDRRSRVSGDHKKKHKKHRSRSDSRDRTARKEKKDKSDKMSESGRKKRSPEDSIVTERALDSPRETSRGYDSFSAQVGATSFSQFPGQYNEPPMGPQSPYTRPDMSSHVQDQFPGQNPEQYATPAFRPGKTVQEGGFGLAADFYNDQGQSVSNQPGIRPESATIITGTQPHLMTASAMPTPPVETGHGSAAEFYDSSAAYDPAPSNPSKQSKPSKTSSSTSNKPSKPTKPEKISSSSAALASGVAGAALGYAASNAHQQPQPSYQQQPRPNYQQASSMSSYPPSINTPLVSQGIAPNQHYHSTSEPVVPTASSYYAPPATSRPSKPGKSSSQSHNSLYAAAGAAGIAAGAYGLHEYQNHQIHHQSTSYNMSEAQSNSYYGRPSPSPYSNGNMAMQHQHKGPVSKFVDWWKDYEDVRKMEEYTEFIGVCRYCFDPRTSVVDAPRRHNYDRRRSSDSLRRRSNDSLRKANSQTGRHSRIDKDSRYYSSDNEKRRKKSSWLSAGLAGYGLAKMGGALWQNNKDFDDTYSIRSGRRNDSSTLGVRANRSRSHSADRRSRSERGVIRGEHDHEYVYVRTKDGGVAKQRVPSNRSRSHSRSRKDGLLGATTAAALGAAAGRTARNRSRERSPRGAFVRTKKDNRERSPRGPSSRRSERSRSRSHSPGLGEILGLTSSRADRAKRGSSGSSYVDVSRTSSSQRNGLFGGIFSSQPEKKPREHRKKKKGFFTFSNSSSSSSNSDLAFGSGFTSQKQSSKRIQKKKSDERLNATLLGIGATAAALAVARNGKKQPQRLPGAVAVQERRGQHARRDRSHEQRLEDDDDDEWESDSDFADSASVSSGLAFGDFDVKGKSPAHRSSMDSLTSQSSGTNKWGWRWGGKSDKKTKPVQASSFYPEQDQYAVANQHFPNGSNGAFYGPPPSDPRSRPHAEDAMSSPSSAVQMQPMQYIDPAPLSESIHSSIPGAFPVQSPVMTSRPGPVPIQQPQPIVPVQPSVYGSHNIHQSSPLIDHQQNYSQPQTPGSLRRTQSSPITSHFARDAALAGVAAITTASILSNGKGRSTKEGSPSSNVRFDLTGKQARKEERERRREQGNEDLLQNGQREPLYLRNEAAEREQEQRRAREREIAEDAVKREADAIRELAERAEFERRKELERQRFEQEALERRKAEIDAEAARRKEDERRRYDTMIAEAAEREADERRRQNEPRRPQWSQYDQDMASQREGSQQRRESDYDNEQHGIHLDENESQGGPSSWQAPVAAGIAGATVGAVLAGSKHDGGKDRNDRILYEVRPSADYNGDFDHEINDRDLFRRQRDESDRSKQEDLARKAAAKVFSDLEDRYRDPTPSQASFFAPKELFEPAKGKTIVADPIGDNDVQVYHVPSIEIEHPSNEPPPPYQPSPGFSVDKDSKSGRTPWGVPKLNIIAPTPPMSYAGSTKGDRSPISPVSDVRDEEAEPHQSQEEEQKHQRDSSVERRRANRVSWGQDQTRIFEVHTPDDSSREQFMSNQDLQDTQHQPRNEIVVENEEHGNEPRKTTYKAEDLPRSSQPPKETYQEESLLDDQWPQQHPSFESVSGLGFTVDSPGTEGAPPIRGFVEGEVDEPTPKEERLPHIPGGFDDELPTPPVVEDRSEILPSKKDKKKKGKASNRAGADDSFFPTVDLPDNEPVKEEPEPDFEVPLSKKEKKKREKAAKRASLEDYLPASPAEPPEPETVQAEPEPDFEIPLNKKDQKKRAKELERTMSDLASPASLPESESWADMMDAEAQQDVQEEFLSKKEKKKRDKAAKRGLDDYDSFPSSPAIETAPAVPDIKTGAEQENDDDMFLSKKDRKKREKERERAAQLALLEEEANSRSPVAEVNEPLEPVNDFEIPLSKKDKKKRDKLAKQASIEDDSSPSTPAEEPFAVEAAEDFDFPLSAKEKKKRAKEAKRQGLDGEAAAVLAGGAIGAALARIDTTSFNRPEQDVRDVEPVDATRNRSEGEERRPSVANNVFDDLDALADAKKLKKKSKRNSGAFHSPTVGSPLRSEVAYDDYIGSAIPVTSKDERAEQDFDLPREEERSPTEARDRKVSEFPSPESERDARSVVSAPAGRDEEGRRHKSRRSRHEDEDYEHHERSRSVAASEPADVYESSKKSKRRSKHDEDFDDAASVTSARSSRSKYEDEDSSKKEKEKKKGGILGLFRRKSSDNASKVQEQEELDAEKDEEKKKKRHHRRRSSERSQFDDGASTRSGSRRRDEDVDDDARSVHSSGSKRRHRHKDGSDDDTRSIRSSSSKHRHRHRDDSGDDDTRSVHSSGSKHRHRHRDDSGDDFDDSRSQVSESRRKHKHRHRDRSADDNKSESRDRKDTNGHQADDRDQSFLAGRVEDEELPPLPASFPSSPTRAPESVDQQLPSSSTTTHVPGATEPGPVPFTTNEEVLANLDHASRAVDEASSSLSGHQEFSLVEVSSTTDLPPLPPSHPSSPFLHNVTPKRPLMQILPVSSTKIPLRFRRPPTSPNTPRERSVSFNTPTVASSPDPSISSPRTRQARPQSHDFRSSTEIRPLWLLESNKKPQLTEEQGQLPSLPSSRTTSRASSSRGSEDYLSAAEDWPSEHGDRDLSILTDIGAEDGQVEDVLGSQQTTPKASSFPAHVHSARPHAEPEYYTWSDVEREAMLHGDPAPEHPQLESSHSRTHSRDTVREVQHQAVDEEMAGSQSQSQDDESRSSFGTIATAAAATAGAATGLLAHKATTVNDDPMASDIWGDDDEQETSAVNDDPLASDVWGDSSDRGDNEPSYFDNALSEPPVESPKQQEPERPTLSRSSSSKKGKKGKKGKEIKLGTASISEPVTPVAPEELRNRRRKDTETFVDSWFDPAPVIAYESKKKGKKGRTKSEDAGFNQSAELAPEPSNDDNLPKAVNDTVFEQIQPEEIAAQIALPETPAPAAEDELLNKTVQKETAEPQEHNDPVDVPLPETPAIPNDRDTRQPEEPSFGTIAESQGIETPEIAESSEYFPLLSRKKSKKGKKKQKQETWDDTPTEVPAGGSASPATAILDASATNADHDPEPAMASEPQETTKDISPTVTEPSFVEESTPTDAVAEPIVVPEEISREITTDPVDEDKAPGPEFQAATPTKAERKKKGRKDRKSDPWADEPAESTSMPAIEVTTPMAEEAPQTEDVEPEFFQPAKKGRKGKKKQKVDLWADESTTTLDVEEPLVEQSYTAENQPVTSQAADGETAPESIELPQTADQNLVEPISTVQETSPEAVPTTTLPPADEVLLPESTPNEAEQALQSHANMPEEVSQPATLEREVGEDTTSTAEAPRESTESDPVDETPQPAQEEESSWFSWLPGTKKKGKKSKGTSQNASTEPIAAPQKPVEEDIHEAATSQSTTEIISEPSIDNTEVSNATVVPAGTESPREMQPATASLEEPENIALPSGLDAPLQALDEQQATAETVALPAEDTGRVQAPAQETIEPNAEDEWVSFTVKKGKKGKKGKKSIATPILTPEPVEVSREAEQPTEPAPADIPLPVEEQPSLTPEKIAMPAEERTSGAAPEDLPLPSEEHPAPEASPNYPTIEAFETQDSASVSQPAELEPQEDFWAPTKKSKKGKKAKKGLDSPAEPMEEVRQEEVPVQQVVPQTEQIEPAEADDFWSMPAKKAKKGKKGKKSIGADEVFDNENNDYEQTQTRELTESSVQENVLEEPVVEQPVELAAEPAMEPAAESIAQTAAEPAPEPTTEPTVDPEVVDEWALPSKKSKKAKKGKKSAVSTPPVMEEPDVPVEVAIASMVPLPVPDEKEEIYREQNDEVAPASGDTAVEPTEDFWAVPTTKKGKKGKKGRKSLIDEPELGSSQDNIEPEHEGKKSKRNSVAVQGELAEPTVILDPAREPDLEDQATITNITQTQHSSPTTREVESPKLPMETDISTAEQERESQANEPPHPDTSVSNDTINGQDETADSEDVFATPLAERQTPFETPAMETPEDNFMTPFEPQTPTPATYEHSVSKLRSQSPTPTRRTSYFGRGATFDPAIDDKAAETSADPLHTPRQVPLPEDSDITPTGVAEERVEASKAPIDLTERAEAQPLAPLTTEGTTAEDRSADLGTTDASLDKLTDQSIPAAVSREAIHDEAKSEARPAEDTIVPEVVVANSDDAAPAGEDEWASGFSSKKSKKDKKKAKKSKSQGPEIEYADTPEEEPPAPIEQLADNSESQAVATEVEVPKQEPIEEPVEEPAHEPTTEPVEREMIEEQPFPVKLSKKDKKKAKKTTTAWDDSWEADQPQEPISQDNVQQKEIEELSTIAETTTNTTSEPIAEPSIPTETPREEPEFTLPTKQSKKDKKKAKKTKVFDDAWSSEAPETPLGEQSSPMASEQNVLDQSAQDEATAGAFEETDDIPKEEDESSFAPPTKLSKKDKKKAKKANVFDDAWSSEALQTPVVEQNDAISSEQDASNQVVLNEPAPVELVEPREIPKEEDEPAFVLPAKLSKKDKKKAKKTSAWEEWPAETTESLPQNEPNDVATPQGSLQLQTVDKDAVPEIIRTPKEEIEFAEPAKTSKKDKKNAKKAKAWEQWPEDEKTETPIEESREATCAEAEPFIEESATHTPALQTEPELDQKLAEETLLPEMQPDLAQQLAEETPLPDSQSVLPRDVAAETEQTIAEPSAEEAPRTIDEPVITQKLAEETPLPEPEFEVPTKLSKKDKRKKKSKAWEEWPSEETQEQERQESSQGMIAEPEQAIKEVSFDEASPESAQAIAEETPLPEPEVEVPTILSKKDKKKKKSKAWEEWPAEETQEQGSLQNVTAESELVSDRAAFEEALPETTQAIAEEMPLPEPEVEVFTPLSKKDKKKKKSKAWEEWPSEEKAIQESSRDVTAEPEQATIDSNFEEALPEQIIAKDTPLPEPEIELPTELPTKLSKKDKKKKKSKAWEEWPSEEKEVQEPSQDVTADPEPVSKEAVVPDDILETTRAVAEEVPLPEPEPELFSKLSKKEKKKAKKGKASLWDEDQESVNESGTTTPVVPAQQDEVPALETKSAEEIEKIDAQDSPSNIDINAAHDVPPSVDSTPEQEDTFIPATTSKKSKKDKKKAKKNAFAWDEADSSPQSPAAQDTEVETKLVESQDPPALVEESAEKVAESTPDHESISEAPTASGQLAQGDLVREALDDVSERPAESQTELTDDQPKEVDRGSVTLTTDDQTEERNVVAEPSEQPKQDIDFAATLAAGLQNSGFDPNLVVDDPIFHRRASPPGQAEADPEEFFPTTKKGKKGKKAKAGKNVESSAPTPMEETTEKVAERSEPNISDDKAAKDDYFSAALTAGLAASGFAASVLQQSTSDRTTAAEEPEEFSFAVSKKKKGKKGKKSLSMTPDVNESTTEPAPDTPVDPAERSFDETPLETPQQHEAPAVQDPEPIALMQEDSFLPQPVEAAVLASEPEQIEASQVQGSVVSEQSREIVEPPADDEWALPVKKKGKKGKKKGAVSQFEDEQTATTDTAEATPTTQDVQSPWLQDMIPDSSRAETAEESAPPLPDEMPKEISPEDKFMEEAFGGFTSKKKKSKKDKKKLVLEDKPAEEIKEEEQPVVSWEASDVRSRNQAVPSGEDAISPTSKVANIFPGLQRVKRRTNSNAPRDVDEQRQEHANIGSSKDAELTRSVPVATDDIPTPTDYSTHRTSDYRESGTFTPIEMDTPIEDQGHKMEFASSSREGKSSSNDIFTSEPTWSFANLRDSGVPSIDSPVAPETPSHHDTVRDSGYNDDGPEEQVATGHEQPRSSDDGLRVSIELNPDWNLPMSKQRSVRKKGKLNDRAVDASIEEESTQDVNRQPSPVDPASKDRTSYLFSSPPGAQAGAMKENAHSTASPIDRSFPEAAGQDNRTDYFDSTPGQVVRQPTSPARLPHIDETPGHTLHERKKSRDISDVGSPEQGVKTARRTATPLQSFRERMSSASLKQADLEGRPQTRDTAGSQVSWPGIEEESENGHEHGLRIEPGRSLGGLGRPLSASSNRPTSAGSHSRRTIRSPSVASNHSGTPSLRRIDRSMSGDLRAASRRGDAPGPKTITIEPPPTPPLQEEDEYAFNGSGNARTPDMSNVYEGWGDVRGSSMSSPTRPPSVRKRQSMHISDLQTQLDQLVAENRRLEEANNNVEQSHRDISQRYDADGQALQVEIEERDEQLQEKDAELQQLRAMLEPLQQEIARLTEMNGELTEARQNLIADTNNRYASMQREHSQTRQQWEDSNRELNALRKQHNELSGGMEGIVRKEISIALQDKNAEIRRLREELDVATQKIRALQSQILSSKTDSYLSAHDEDYFDTACQKLCQHVQQWVLRFSKYSDNRMCRLTSDIADEKIEGRLDNTILDGSDVDKLLGDRVRRRDVFMSLVMSMIWEYVFTRYLFGMDREQRQKLKALEKILLEVGPARAVAHWRATTLTLLSRRPAFATQRNLDTEAVAQEIFAVLSTLLPPPSQLESQILASLRNVLRLAVDLAIEMRTQRAEYIMLPPLQPEYDTNGDLVRKVHFNAALMNERSGEYSSNDELERTQSVVKMVLFPLVVKKGNEEGEGDDEIVVCPAQVLVAGAKTGKKVVRVLSGAMEIDEPRRSKQSLMSGIEGSGSNMI